MASSELLIPHPLSTLRVCPPPHQRRGGTHSPAVRGWGLNIFNISEDARHWIGLLQYNPSTDLHLVMPGWETTTFHGKHTVYIEYLQHKKYDDELASFVIKGQTPSWRRSGWRQCSAVSGRRRVR
jgi:hypothetical protein